MISTFAEGYIHQDEHILHIEVEGSIERLPFSSDLGQEYNVLWDEVTITDPETDEYCHTNSVHVAAYWLDKATMNDLQDKLEWLV